jgi:hypothetical protein
VIVNIKPETGSRLDCSSFYDTMSSHILPQNVKIKIYEAMVKDGLTVLLYDSESCPAKAMEEQRVRIFKNIVLKRKLEHEH